MECSKCGNEFDIYKFEEEIYCFDCLLKEMNIEREYITKYIDDDKVIDEEDILDYIEEYGAKEI